MPTRRASKSWDSLTSPGSRTLFVPQRLRHSNSIQDRRNHFRRFLGGAFRAREGLCLAVIPFPDFPAEASSRETHFQLAAEPLAVLCRSVERNNLAAKHSPVIVSLL